MPRQSSLDVLRSFAAFQVIYYHIGQYIGVFFKPTLSNIFIFINILFKTNDFYFMLISFYISARSRLEFSKLLPICIQTFTYSVFKYLVQVYFYKTQPFTWNEFQIALTPLIHNRMGWYTMPFLFTKVLFSFISPALEKRSKKFHFKLMLLISFWLFLETEGCFEWIGFIRNEDNLSSSPFIVAGFGASYIAFYGKEIKLKWSILTFIISFIWNFYIHHIIEPSKLPSLFQIIGIRQLLNPKILYFPTYVLALSSFHIITQIPFNPSHPVFLQTIAETSFGIFILADSKTLLDQIRQNNLHLIYHQTFLYVRRALLSSIKIYVCCVIIEITRKKLTDLFLFRRSYYHFFVDLIDRQ